MFSASVRAILTPKRNWRQCLCKILGWETKSIMVCYSIFWSGQFLYPFLLFRMVKGKVLVTSYLENKTFSDYKNIIIGIFHSSSKQYLNRKNERMVKRQDGRTTGSWFRVCHPLFSRWHTGIAIIWHFWQETSRFKT